MGAMSSGLAGYYEARSSIVLCLGGKCQQSMQTDHKGSTADAGTLSYMQMYAFAFSTSSMVVSRTTVSLM